MKMDLFGQLEEIRGKRAHLSRENDEHEDTDYEDASADDEEGSSYDDEDVTVDDDTEDGGEAVVNDEVGSTDVTTELVDTEEKVEEVNNGEEQFEEAEAAAVAAEGYLRNLLFMKGQKNFTFNPAHAEAISIGLEAATRNLPSHMQFQGVVDTNMESYQTATGTELALESVIDSIKDFMGKLLDTIIRGFHWLVEKAQQIWASFFASVKKLRKYIKEIRERAKESKSGKLKEGKTKMKDSSYARFLRVEGKLVKSNAALDLLYGVSNKLAKARKQAEIAARCINISKSVMKDMDMTERREHLEKESNDFLTAFSAIVKINDLEVLNDTDKRVAEKYRLNVPADHDFFASAALPRNKRLCAYSLASQHWKDPDKASSSSLKVGLFTYTEDGNGDTKDDLDYISIKQVLTELNKAEKILDDVELLKKRSTDISNANKAISKTMNAVRVKYLAITKKQRNGESFAENFRITRGKLKLLNAGRTMLKEPAMSFTGYALVTLKGILDYLNANASAYEKDDKPTTTNSSRQVRVAGGMWD